MIKFLLLFTVLFIGCSSSDKKLFLDAGTVNSGQVCGTESFLNQYALFKCNSLELESTNDYINQNQPLHNIKGVVVSRRQKLLVVEEKIFNPRVKEPGHEVVCTRRLKVILNPGVGKKNQYHVGWLTYDPACLTFYKVRPSSQKSFPNKLFSKSN